MLNDVISQVQAIFGAHVDWKQVVLMAATPIFIVAFIVELYVRKAKGPGHRMWSQFEWREILTNLGLGGSYQVFELLLHIAITGAVINWIYQFRVFDIPVNAWTVVPLFVLMEFCYYWFHRASHRIRWFWSAHVVHHSSETMNMTTAMRQSLLYSVTGWWLFFMPMVLLGVHPGVVFTLYAVNLFYQYFIHTEAIGKLHPWLEFWFNTPSAHRVHHGRNPEYIDRNYGGVLIIFDRMFGTYTEEQDDNPVEYGIVDQIHSHNIITLNFHEFNDMWRDVFAADTVKDWIKQLVLPPKWDRPQS